ncbi:MarR family winged helix-turn-helix transcriptional regulator [Paraglaciecola aquimarina]|uniref:MarR family winged helix-turn-helix transcriptional regulator n=1 Tax=Paraglaciecola aquimarina TaxID=1235557 RepID=A0ABU3SY26_9ALTE|nr:MarR family winged helix-turn-helix transcriptional regulator [Paraglaciecola aquimarina]MDU0354910.1 MarR family winged helix-turn-helix transcriptional regulator [Paraglaciecola aquimarina]
MLLNSITLLNVIKSGNIDNRSILYSVGLKIVTKQLIAVLTGDIVGSQKIAPQYYDTMLQTIETTFSWFATKTEINFDLFRGDAFQAVFTTPSMSISSAIILRLALKICQPSFSARQSIGIGTATALRAKTKISTGEAFLLSGTGLDQIKGNLLTIHTSQANFQTKIGLLTKFLDNHLADLTTTQSEVLLCYLRSEDKSHDAIAKTLNKTRSNVTRLLNACRYQLIVDYIRHFENCLAEEFTDV